MKTKETILFKHTKGHYALNSSVSAAKNDILKAMEEYINSPRRSRDIPFLHVKSAAESMGVDIEKMDILKQAMFKDIENGLKMPEIMANFNKNYDLNDAEWTYISYCCGFAFSQCMKHNMF